MDVWTIQKREIMEMVKTGIVWYPELKKAVALGFLFAMSLPLGYTTITTSPQPGALYSRWPEMLQNRFKMQMR